jgi:DNA-binding CsgD family transcriptional regulator
MAARFVVLEGAEPQAVRDAVAQLAADGAQVRHGWHPAQLPTVCVGQVTGDEDAAKAVLAAVAGARLVIAAVAPREVIDRLCDDLQRLGELDHRVGVEGPAVGAAERALLAELLAGASLGEAARRLHISRRTADRRLAAARAALNASTTAEALRAAVGLGIGPAPRR